MLRLQPRDVLAHAINAQGEHARAAALFAEVAKGYRDLHGPRHPLVLKARCERAGSGVHRGGPHRGGVRVPGGAQTVSPGHRVLSLGGVGRVQRAGLRTDAAGPSHRGRGGGTAGAARSRPVREHPRA
ncbi:HPr family phosphocarrier protein [Streptomyces sp. NPDC002550]